MIAGLAGSKVAEGSAERRAKAGGVSAGTAVTKRSSIDKQPSSFSGAAETLSSHAVAHGNFRAPHQANAARERADAENIKREQEAAASEVDGANEPGRSASVEMSGSANAELFATVLSVQNLAVGGTEVENGDGQDHVVDALISFAKRNGDEGDEGDDSEDEHEAASRVPARIRTARNLWARSVNQIKVRRCERPPPPVVPLRSFTPPLSPAGSTPAMRACALARADESAA